MPTFDGNKLLEELRLSLDAVYEDGTIRVSRDTVEGRESKNLDINKLVQSRFPDINLEETPIKFENTPKTALNQTPVSVAGRIGIAFGNEKGAIESLKKQFSDVVLDEDKGIVIKDDDGIWKVLDPDQFGGKDPWELSRHIKEGLVDVAEFGASIAPQVALTAGALALTGAAPVSLAGAAIAGAAGGLGSLLKTSLGKIIGTQKSTPEEELQEVGLEVLFNAGGVVLQAGMRPTLKFFKESAKNIRQWGSDTSIDTISALAGGTTGMGSRETRRLIERTDNVTGIVSSLKKSSKAVRPGEKAIPGSFGDTDAINKGTTNQLDDLNQILESSISELPKQYETQLNSLLSLAETKNISVNIGKIRTDAFNEIVEQGFGKVDSKTGRFVKLTPTEIDARQLKGLPAEGRDLSNKEFVAVARAAQQIKGGGKIKSVNGSIAAEILAADNKSINALVKQAGIDKQPAFKRAMTIVSATYKKRLGEVFEQNGMSTEYSAMQKLYQEFADPVNSARKILDNDKSGTSLLTKLFSETNTRGQATAELDKLISLGGKRSEMLYERILDTESAKRAIPLFPKKLSGVVGVSSIGGAAAAAIAAGAPLKAVSLPLLPIAAQFSPKIVTKEIKAMNTIGKFIGKGSNVLKSLPPDQLKRALQSDTFIRNVYSESLDAAGDVTGMTEVLVNRALPNRPPQEEQPPQQEESPQPQQQQQQQQQEQQPPVEAPVEGQPVNQ